MRIRHFAQGKFYTIRCPQGTRVVRNSTYRASGKPDPCDGIVVPYNGREIPIPADPPELLPLLAESGRCGLSMVGEPEPDVRLAGASCPGCGEDDVNWLQLRDDSEAVHCDRCRHEFGVPVPTVAPVTASPRAGG